MNYRKSLAIAEMKLEKCHEQGYKCPVCGEYVDVATGELAHRIPQRRWCLARWGAKVIHHSRNLVLTHPGRCNDAVSISNHPLECERLAREIQEELGG
jgi:hypothetical protein